MGPVDFVILALVAALLFFAVRHAVRHRGDSCRGDCSRCPYHGNCGKRTKK